MKTFYKLILTFCLLTASFFFATAQTITSITGGGGHSLAIKNDGTVKSWGANNFGELGNGTFTSSNVPLNISSLTGIIAIAAGANHSLALKNDGTLQAWGYNQSGPLGNGTNTNSNVPVSVSSITDVTTIAAGNIHSLALKSDGTVWAWGSNFHGTLGNGTSTDSNVPVQVSSLTGMKGIAGGWRHSLALKNDGTVWAWGLNQFGQLGNGSNTNSNVPVQTSSLTDIIAVAGGGGYVFTGSGGAISHSLALKNDGTVWAWGCNLYGQLGNGINTDSNVPVQVSSLTGIIAIAAGSTHSVALKNDGTVWTWGGGSSGILGTGAFSSNIPVQVSSITGITNIGTGLAHSFALNNNCAWAWGGHGSGQLGTGAVPVEDGNGDIYTAIPIEVVGLCQITEVNELLAGQAGEQQITIYPNPSTGKFNFQPKNLTEPTTVEIYNMLGEQVYSLANASKSLTQLDLRSQPTGIYFINIKTEAKSFTQKLIIQK